MQLAALFLAALISVALAFNDSSASTECSPVEGTPSLASCSSLRSRVARTFEEITVVGSGCKGWPEKPLPRLRNLRFDCSVESLPPFGLEQFPSLRLLSFAECKLKLLPWQSLSSSNASLTVDLSACPLNCSCLNAWLFSDHPPFFSFPEKIKLPPSLKRCPPSSCPSPLLTPSSHHITTTLGSSLSLHVSVSPPQHPSLTVLPPLPYFDWLGDFRMRPPANETVKSEELWLGISTLSASHLGEVVALCWHCTHPAFSQTRIEMEVAMLARLDESGSEHLLHIRGFPLDSLSLSVVKGEMEGNDSFPLAIPLSTDSVGFLNGSISLQPHHRFWLFHQRVYRFVPTLCSDCEAESAGGLYSLRLCQGFLNDSLPHCLLLQAHISVPEVRKGQEGNGLGQNHRPAFSAPLILLVFSVALLFLFVGFFCRRCKQKKRSSGVLSRRCSGATEETRLEERRSISSEYSRHSVVPTIQLGNIHILERIGKGAYGEVYRANCQGSGDEEVAVKVLCSADEREEREAALLSRLRHPNIVRLFGTARDGERLLLVFELMNLGDLRSYVSARRPQNELYSQFPPALQTCELIAIVRQTSKGRFR